MNDVHARRTLASILVLVVPVVPETAIGADSYPACLLESRSTPDVASVADPATSACVDHPLEWRDAAEQRMDSFREATGEPPRDRRLWGLALSGGGSKAAPVAVGVLAGLYDTGLLHKLDYISSVSGGGYGAYFFYTRFLNDEKAKVVSDQYRLARAFNDCYRSTGALEALGVPGDEMCNALGVNWPIGSPRPVNKAFVLAKTKTGEIVNVEQAWLRCRQDVLEPKDCNFAGTGSDVWTARRTAAGLVVASSLTAPVHHVMNSVFDWGVSLSPSRYVYSRGIGISYGTTQRDAAVLDPNAKAKVPTEAYDVPEHSFADLAQITREKRLPIWIINATAVPHRSLFGWLRSPTRDFARDSFEFTPHSFGSARLGFVNRSRDDLSVLDAVVTSAAFFDANQIAKGSGRALLAVGQHTFNANWGIDIANWNTSAARRAFHRAMPFPLYYLDGFVASRIAANSTDDTVLRQDRIDRVSSTFVRLVDGGSADNTGAYALVRRGVKNIIIVDAAQDKRSEFEDLALLCREAYRHHRLYLVFPHIDEFGAFTRPAGDPADPARPGCSALPSASTYQGRTQSPIDDKARGHGVGLIYRWPAPVIYGCLSKSAENACLDTESIRIYLLKPAVDAISLHRRAQSSAGADATGDACIRKLGGESRYGTEPDRWSAQALPCEPTLYALQNYTSKVQSDFPQDATVATTMNSSHSKFAAYRDLMRFYAQFLPGNDQVDDDLGLSEKRFHESLRRQANLVASGLRVRVPVSKKAH